MNWALVRPGLYRATGVLVDLRANDKGDAWQWTVAAVCGKVIASGDSATAEAARCACEAKAIDMLQADLDAILASGGLPT